MRTINDLFDALMGELEGLDTGGAREIVREIRSRLLTSEAVDGLPKEVCEAIHDQWMRCDGYTNESSGRAMASAVAAHLAIPRPDGDAGEIGDCKLCGKPWPHGHTNEQLEEWKRRGGIVADHRPIISDASQATDEQCMALFRETFSQQKSSADDVALAGGRAMFRAALDAVRLDASPLPVLTENEIDDALECFERCGEFISASVGGYTHRADEQITRRWTARLESASAALARLGAGGAVQPDASPATPAPLDTADADKELAAIESQLLHIGLSKERSSIRMVHALRGRLVLPKPRRLSDEEAAKLAGMAYFQELKSSTTDTEDGHAIAAEVARLWGLPAPEPETPKVRRLTDQEARQLAGRAAYVEPNEEQGWIARGHAIADFALCLLGLEYPK